VRYRPHRPSAEWRDAEALRDLAALVERELFVSQLATIDPLTGLLNRRGFDLAARQVLEMHKRSGSETTLVYIDLDDIKGINDTLGHEAGDEALEETAQLLRRTFRSSDILARVGGDEFCVLLTGASSPDALRRLKQAVEERRHWGRYTLSLSVGSASSAEVDTSLEDLMRRADQSMYVDKHSRPHRGRAGSRMLGAEAAGS